MLTRDTSAIVFQFVNDTVTLEELLKGRTGSDNILQYEVRPGDESLRTDSLSILLNLRLDKVLSEHQKISVI